ncbi:cystathionine gamma-synthase family protein [Reinekea marinisedimentorum]|uniref:O-acetylhomoserine (Thiol)-lyase n=1 Tax=Reinekea marinisedimentorum TaxID=230495 RepID=A0A4R3IG52_9GAMM|nr:cystathionine gamma-synthase family protein [Reinekea marinisedimentorum]TCS43982.1 O-acetylhomoserine (thiol)-lyase [Reinekea marinisedimentorum]
MSQAKGFTSRIVHHDRLQGFTDGPVHAPVYNSVPYGYQSTQDLVDVFQGVATGQVYARQATPTTESLQSMITQAEQGVGTLVFATGMAAISAVFFSMLKAGDHLITSQYLFGNTHSLIKTMEGFGIEVSFVDTTDVAAVAAAKQENTRMVYTETIANPGTQVADLAAIGDWCESQGIVYFVDNTITSPYLFRPKAVKASLVMNSLSKYFCGHGTVLGGSVTDTGLFNWETYPHIFAGYKKGDPKKWALTQIKKKSLRDMGASLSSDAAFQIAVGAETMALRMDRSNSNALALAELLAAHPKVARVYYPGLAAHPQHQTATELFKSYGSILSFDLAEGFDCAALLDDIDLIINATHLGDNRTLALPMASTIFFEMGAENRAKLGIGDRMIRCSIGIEDTDDLLTAFSEALDRL